ncbi:MAG: sensor histidine kinase [Mangrovibacterium sp.]
MNGYAVSLTHVRSLVVKEIMPQILFSVLLTLIIATAFFLMHKSLRSQERLMKLKNDFINNITHELKTPVATVSVAIEALQNFSALDNPELTREYLTIARNELNRLTLMTDKILSTSLFERGTMSFSPEKIDLDRTVQQILASMKLVFEKRKASVSYEKEGSDPEMEGSPTHLTNVIYNLIDNSLKYSLKDPVISIRLKSLPDRLVLTVKDNGIGIRPEFRERVFEKFFRVPTGDVHNVKGHGLGLSYVAAVVKDHGGSVTVDSVPDEGSCFTVSLPKKFEG